MLVTFQILSESLSLDFKLFQFFSNTWTIHVRRSHNFLCKFSFAANKGQYDSIFVKGINAMMLWHTSSYDDDIVWEHICAIFAYCIRYAQIYFHAWETFIQQGFSIFNTFCNLSYNIKLIVLYYVKIAVPYNSKMKLLGSDYLIYFWI